MPVVRHGSLEDDTKSRGGDLEASKSGRRPRGVRNPHESEETAFRGFEKIPQVVLPRYDISPYLKTMNISQKTKPKRKNSIGFEKSTIDERFFSCQVRMFRDDLDRMKETVGLPERHYTCKICSKKYPDIKKLRNHHDNKHLIVFGPLKPPKRVSFSDKVIIHEVREYHECRKCTKIFESYILLKKHMKENHKKRKCYICHYCSKKFVDRSIFKVHIKLHCDVCGGLSPTKLKYAEHRRYVCKVYKLHKCSTCDLAFYKFMDLKDHSYDHLRDLFVCDVCKDQFNTKCGVAHHIKFLHSKSRPDSLYEMRLLGSDRLYLCNFCDESSVEKTSIKSHVQLLPDLSNRAMTGYKDFYFCDQCMKKFERENEMLQHKWTHFLIESPESDKKKVELDKKNVESVKKKVDPVKNKVDSVQQIPDSTKSEKQMLELAKEMATTIQPKVLVKRLSIDDLEKKANQSKINSAITGPTDLKTPNNNKEPDRQKEKEVESQTEKNIETQKQINPETEEIEGREEFNCEEIVLSKKALVVNHRTIVSRHQCEVCNKYFSNGFCLRRHTEQVHRDYDNLRCRDCEETFVWPSLLLSHNCLRAPQTDESFDDARPEILFDNIPRIPTDSYESCVDFDIPTPIVEMSPEQNGVNMHNGQNGVLSGPSVSLLNGVNSCEKLNSYVAAHNSGFKIVVQEVPIEF